MATHLSSNTQTPPITLLRLREACARQGKSRSGFYDSISAGLMTRPVKLGTASAWPDHEVDTVNRAHIAGKSADDIRQLVKKLEADRKALA